MTTFATKPSLENQNAEDKKKRLEKENAEEWYDENMRYKDEVKKFKVQDTKSMMHMHDGRYSADRHNALEINLSDAKAVKYSNSIITSDNKSYKHVDLNVPEITEKMESLDGSSIE